MARRQPTVHDVMAPAVCAAVAAAFRYPRPGLAAELDAATSTLTGAPRRALSRFARSVTDGPLAGWEELHTRTLDLSPLVAPYVGFAVWGETYHRGVFLADLAAAQRDAGVDADGELPDHLDPVLRYLAVAPDPLTSLVGALPVAAGRMHQQLRSIERSNPYVHALDALRQVTAPLADLAPPPHVTQPADGLPVIGG